MKRKKSDISGWKVCLIAAVLTLSFMYIGYPTLLSARVGRIDMGGHDIATLVWFFVFLTVLFCLIQIIIILSDWIRERFGRVD